MDYRCYSCQEQLGTQTDRRQCGLSQCFPKRKHLHETAGRVRGTWPGGQGDTPKVSNLRAQAVRTQMVQGPEVNAHQCRLQEMQS